MFVFGRRVGAIRRQLVRRHIQSLPFIPGHSQSDSPFISLFSIYLEESLSRSKDAKKLVRAGRAIVSFVSEARDFVFLGL
jgi:hypothetical protein